MAATFTALFDLAMKIERDRHLGAGPYERTEHRQGYASGYKPKKVDTPAGTVTVQVPKSRGCDAPFYPQALERGRTGGRPPSLSEQDRTAAKALLRDPAITVEAAAKRLGVAPSTLYRHLPGGRGSLAEP